jgi:hypothetical protein
MHYETFRRMDCGNTVYPSWSRTCNILRASCTVHHKLRDALLELTRLQHATDPANDHGSHGWLCMLCAAVKPATTP